MAYNQFCPVAKAMEILGERWTLLLIREVLMGATRFNELQRGLSNMSPTLLTKRLVQLEQEGLLVRKKIPGQKGYEYFPTEMCRELFPVLEQVGIWGMHWARHKMTEDDYDLELLMVHLERSIQADKLPGKESVLRFNFTDVKDYPNWWIVAAEDSTDVCVVDPGKEVDVYFNVSVKVMCQLWMGEISYKQAIAEGKLNLLGPKALTRDVENWIRPSIFAGIQPASQILHSH